MRLEVSRSESSSPTGTITADALAGRFDARSQYRNVFVFQPRSRQSADWVPPLCRQAAMRAPHVSCLVVIAFPQPCTERREKHASPPLNR